MVFRDDIQGLRAVAVLLVLLCHFGVPGFSGGFIGVDIFFLISGYLITGLIVAETEATGKFSILSFYARRFLRLLPALAVMLLAVSALACVLYSPQEQFYQAMAAAPSAVWMSNFHYATQQLNYFDPSNRGNLFLHTWSLGVEEQFYLIWPLVLLVSLRSFKKNKRSDIPTLIVTLFLLSLLGCLIITYMNVTWAYYMMPTRLWQFLIGGIIFLTYHKYSSFETVKKHWSLHFFGIILLVSSVFVLSTQKYYPGYLALLPSIGVAMLLWPNSDSITSKILSSAGLKFIGNISYSLYLWHWPVWQFINTWLPTSSAVKVLAAFLLSFGVSVVSYYCVEIPFRRTKLFKRYSGVVIVVSIIACILLFKFAEYWGEKTKLWTKDEIFQPYKNVRVDHLYAQGCDEWYRSSSLKPCMFGSSTAPHTVILVGDSLASQWIHAVQKLYSAPEWNVIAIVKSACPLVDENKFYNTLGRDYVECSIWRQQVFEYIAQKRPDTVIMASGIENFTEEQWVEGTSRLIKRIHGHTESIFIMAPTPRLAFDGPECLMREKWANKFFELNGLCFSGSNNKKVVDTTTALKKVADRYSHAYLVDMKSTICPNEICYAERNGQIVFRDSQHLTASYVKSISDAVKNEFEKSMKKNQ